MRFQYQIGIGAAHAAGVINNYDECLSAVESAGPIAENYGIPTILTNYFGKCACKEYFNGDGGSGLSWHHDGDSFGQVDGEISAVYAPQRDHSEIFFREPNGTLHYC